jgi:lysophospholipase L1-like esterase
MVMIGDSLSVGYAPEIQKVAAKQGIQIKDFDAQVGRVLSKGEQSGLTVIDHSGAAIAGSQVVVLALGTNMVENEAEYKAALLEAISKIRTEQPNVRIVIPRLYSFRDGSAAARRRDQRNQIIEQVAAQTGVEAVDISQAVDTPAERQANMTADQVHLTRSGYQTTARSLMEQIKG